MDKLLENQRGVHKRISNFITNTTKKGKKTFSENFLQTRCDLLKEYWNKFQAVHEQLLNQATPDDLTKEYFKNNEYDDTEIAYCEAAGYLKDLLDSVRPQPSEKPVTPISSSNHVNPLPKIQLPKFGGELKDWPSFRDLFKSLIDSNDNLSGSQKLYYLRTVLYGEAEKLVRNTAITDANYASAWKILTDRYENKRLLVHSYLKLLTSLPAMKAESADELKRLFDGTTEAIKALEALNRPVNTWDDWLIFLTVNKLDSVTRKDWEASISEDTELVKFDQLFNFLKNRIHTLEAAGPAIKHKEFQKITFQKPQYKSNLLKAHHVSTVGKCPNCTGKHYLLFCPSFRQRTVSQRNELVSEKRLCSNCLRANHSSVDCPSPHRCKHCQQRHHSLLHNFPATSYPSTPAASDGTKDQCSSTNSGTSFSNKSLAALATSTIMRPVGHVLLATARVILKSPNGRRLQARALLDQGSEGTFITSSIVDLLQLPEIKVHVPLTGIGSSLIGAANRKVRLQIQSCIYPDFEITADALVLPTLTEIRNPSKIKVSDLPHLRGLQLADPTLADNSPIDLIIGADIYHELLLEGIKFGHPTAQNTILGWILSGPIKIACKSSQKRILHAHIAYDSDDLSSLIQKFWEYEEASVPDPSLTEEDLACEQFYSETVRRDSNGRYIVRLPIKPCYKDTVVFGDSRLAAIRSFHYLERRFESNPSFNTHYVAFMREYQELDHMKPIINEPTPTSPLVFYLPHHGVIREDSLTTKLRVVFNGSRNSRGGLSLNDYLAAGPKLQNDLRSIILTWRKYAYVFAADIKMMFRQIRIDDRDADLQRIIWRESKNEPLQDFRLCTVTYGTRPAPYLAIRRLLQLAKDEGHNYPLGAEILRHEIYVDDILSGADSVADALDKQKQLIGILRSGGFLLHKWSSNHDKLLQAIDNESPSSTSTLCLNQDNAVKTLGLQWNPRSDTFGFKVTLGDPPAVITKRNLLSDVAKLYDPLGFLTPALLLAKAMFQQLWLLKVDWDSQLPEHVVQEWLSLRSQLKQLEVVTVPRWVGCYSSSLSYELHAFSDASEKAYSAVVYLRVHHDYHNVQVSLLCSKTKLAPIKRLSIPRLELAGAWLMARLIKTVQTSMSFEEVPTYCWCDSQTVLIWLTAHPSKWKPYVANRVSSIHETVPTAKWKHVPGSCNPADLASRGVLPSKLLNHPIWWKGPSWLTLPSTSWPNPNVIIPADPGLEFEERKTSHVAIITPSIEIWDLATRFSSLNRLLRITAYCRRFVTNLKSPINNRYLGLLKSAEVNDSLVFWIKSFQQAGFPNEYNQLAMGRKIHIKSPILRLSPFFDNATNTLRVGGRLQQSNLTSDAKHQFLIPKDCHLANLIIADAHQQTLHGGTTLCVSYIRQRFWIVACREKVHNHIKRCLVCFRQRALAQTQLMGMLPAYRVKSVRPFLFSGLDYAGPVQVRYGPGRGRPAHKAYIALFVCLATKAIHLELVSDLSTQAFIAAFKRFTARRGFCRRIYSDNAKTFVGADNELKRSLFIYHFA